MSSTKDLIIYGPGKVGKELARQLLEFDSHKRRIVGIANSKGMAYNPEGLPIEGLKKLASDQRVLLMDIFQNDLWEEYNPETPEQIIPSILTHMPKQERGKLKTILVDTTPGIQGMRELYFQALRKPELGLVTASKTFASETNTLEVDMCLKTNRFGVSANVMAGPTLVNNAQEFAENYTIRGFGGIYSGTWNYMTWDMGQGALFSEALKKAYEKGFLEPKFADDLRGTDALRKHRIVGLLLGLPFNMDEVAVDNPPVDESLLSRTDDIDKFLEIARAEIDPKMREQYEKARQEGNTLKYSAEAELTKNGAVHATIGLKAVPAESGFDTEGATNRLAIQSKEGKSFEQQGPGAGPKETAEALRLDIDRIAA